MNPVVHFEMPYDDPARMQKFYQAAFGWKMQMLGQEMGNYVVAKTGPTTADGWPTEVGVSTGASSRVPAISPTSTPRSSSPWTTSRRGWMP